MTITRNNLLFGIDHKQFGAQAKMDKAIIDILDEIHAVSVLLKNMTDGSVRLDGGALHEIMGARARGRFYGRLLMEAIDHFGNTSLHDSLSRAMQEASTRLEENEKLAKALLELYD